MSCRAFDHAGKVCVITAAVNQIELHPYLQQAGPRREHDDRGERTGPDPDEFVRP